MYYGIKKFIHEQIQVIPVIQNKIGGTLKGRHILELEFEFYKDKDFEHFNGVELLLFRDEKNVKNYPHQKFTFLIKNEAAVLG